MQFIPIDEGLTALVSVSPLRSLFTFHSSLSTHLMQLAVPNAVSAAVRMLMMT